MAPADRFIIPGFRTIAFGRTLFAPEAGFFRTGVRLAYGGGLSPLAASQSNGNVAPADGGVDTGVGVE
jgi:hypothetical protein